MFSVCFENIVFTAILVFYGFILVQFLFLVIVFLIIVSGCSYAICVFLCFETQECFSFGLLYLVFCYFLFSLELCNCLFFATHQKTALPKFQSWKLQKTPKINQCTKRHLLKKQFVQLCSEIVFHF